MCVWVHAQSILQKPFTQFEPIWSLHSTAVVVPVTSSMANPAAACACSRKLWGHSLAPHLQPWDRFLAAKPVCDQTRVLCRLRVRLLGANLSEGLLTHACNVVAFCQARTHCWCSGWSLVGLHWFGLCTCSAIQRWRLCVCWADRQVHVAIVTQTGTITHLFGWRCGLGTRGWLWGAFARLFRVPHRYCAIDLRIKWIVKPLMNASGSKKTSFYIFCH